MAKGQRRYKAGAKYETTGPAGKPGKLVKVGTAKIKGKTYMMVEQRPRKRRSN